MREAIGGTWIMGIVIFFIILFSSYLAISVNYSRAFKVKNEIINVIEKYQGHSLDAQGDILDRLNTIGYFVFSTCTFGDNPWEGFSESSNGSGRYRYCVAAFCEQGANVTMPRAYYSVGVFFRLDLPIFRDIFTFPVTGETKTISSAAVTEDCANAAR